MQNRVGDVLGDVNQGIVGNRIEKHVGIAETKIEIDQGYGVLRVLGEDATKVDGQTGRAHAAGRAGDGDHLASTRRLSP